MPLGQAGRGTCAYWLRSSTQSEWEYRVNQLRTPADLRELIEYVARSGSQQLHLGQCHHILVQCLRLFVGDERVTEALQGMDLATLIQYAEGVGFWNASVLPGLQNHNMGMILYLDGLMPGLVDQYTTPPSQMFYQNHF